jgi:hypothetical protein
MSSGTWERDTSVLVRLEGLVARVREDACESDRKALLAELCELLNHPEIPDSARILGMELAGKLARRANGERACQSGLGVMLERIRQRSR